MNNLKRLGVSERDLVLVQQHCSHVDPEEPIGFEYDGAWIVDIFQDSTGRFTLSLDEAIQEYGFDNVKNFVHQVIQYYMEG